MRYLFLWNKKYINAIKEFESIIKTDPRSEYAEVSQINIGWAYFLNGDYKRALKAYEKALQKYPGTKRTTEILEREYQLGIAQMDTNEEAAISVFEKIIEKHHLGHLSPDAQVKIADCYFKLEQYEEALDAYEKFLENYPKTNGFLTFNTRYPLRRCITRNNRNETTVF